MKKSILALVAALLITAFSCTPVVGPGTTPNPEPTAVPELEIPEGKGAITISIPSSKAVTSSIAQAYSDTYEVLIMKDGNDSNSSSSSFKISAVIDSNSSSKSKTIYIQPGTYKVLVLAGRSASSSVMLLGSSFTKNVSIYEGQATSLNVLLDSIYFDLSVPSQVECGSEYTISASINMNSSVLRLSSTPGFNLRNDNNGSYYYGNNYYFISDGNSTGGNSTIPSTQVYTKTLIAGSTESNGTVTFNADTYRSYIWYNDSTNYYNSTYLHYMTTKSWFFLTGYSSYLYYLPAALKNELVKPITFIPSSTKLNLNIGWR